ncbi:hypothetical protein SAV31267_007610 [Streptomyces avermitilis]|uniref:Histidinol dehydrogenase n=1 Tax=Streptomyces avermitilis TaxID=33903 RepID=A0A4D4MHI9_STRAX|nr:hypothetical protein SAV31267_007610 [Streptomyces avermitilis]
MSRTIKAATTSSTAPSGNDTVGQTVRELIADVRNRGDEAVRELSARFDRWEPESFRLGNEQLAEIIGTLDPQVIEDIKTVQANVRRFAEAQRESMSEIEIETARACSSVTATCRSSPSVPTSLAAATR